MSRALITEAYLEDIASAIRGKNGSSDTYTPPQMAAAIQAIPTGGITPTGTLEITENGTYDVTQYASVNINVSGGGGSVTIVPWATGTDEEIAAMIDAAHAGKLDLQQDGGWAVGDTRTIIVGAFTDSAGTAHAQQSIEIVISSFADYNECGCIMQFDFKDCLVNGVRMGSSGTNYQGYGATEMKNTTLPALANVLPEWIKTRLIEFPVLVSAGSKSSTIETITGNKLALRSEVEVCGTTSMSFSGEGSLAEYYKIAANRSKKQGISGSNTLWWSRSPVKNSNTSFVSFSSGTATYDVANTARGVAPFGCL